MELHQVAARARLKKPSTCKNDNNRIYKCVASNCKTFDV